jgi:hypothetical protein
VDREVSISSPTWKHETDPLLLDLKGATPSAKGQNLSKSLSFVSYRKNKTLKSPSSKIHWNWGGEHDEGILPKNRAMAA